MYFPDEIILAKAIFLTWRHVLTLTRVATVSVPIVPEACARRGAGFSRFLQLVPGEGESRTTGKLCVLRFFYKGQLNLASLCHSGEQWNVFCGCGANGEHCSYLGPNFRASF